VAELLPPLKPIQMKERLSVLYIEKGHLDVLDVFPARARTYYLACQPSKSARILVGSGASKSLG
jgi:hypothetical protein